MLIHKFQTASGRRYVYDAWTNEILEVDAEIYDALPPRSGNSAELSPRVATEIASARQAGLLREDRPDVRSFPPAERARLLRRLKERGPELLILNVTERCNLRCRYCPWSGAYEDNRTHSERVMPEETLRKAIAWYLSFPRDADSISFYGGEPLCDLELIRRAVDFALDLAKRPIQFRITTNATLLHPRACDFLAKHDFRLSVSIDGPQEVHDRYRLFGDGRGSFAAVWKGLETLRSSHPDYFRKRVAYNVVAASPARLIAIRDFFASHPEFFASHRLSISRVNPYPSCLPEFLLGGWRDPEFRAQREEAFGEFRARLLRGEIDTDDFHFQLFADNFIDMHQRVTVPMKPAVPSHGQCVPGGAKCFVDTDGSLHMCERVGDGRPIGHVSTGLDLRAISRFLREYDEFFRACCADCWALRLCSKCFVHLRVGGEFSTSRRAEVCATEQRKWSWIIRQYCEIREEKADAFAWCKGIPAV
ncbi:MAG TPA: radical SAM protein [Verrucomicrobiae bacterium]|nr:radical SAM protein [Verrucomicrobiae bacterium]